MQQIGTVSELQSGSFLSSPLSGSSGTASEIPLSASTGPGMRTADERSHPAARLAPTHEERRNMQAHIRHIRRRSLLTPQALAQLGASELPADTRHALLTLLEGPFEERWEERIAATWALGLARLTPRQSRNISTSLIGLLQRKSLVRPVRVGFVTRRLNLTPEPTVVLASAYLFILVFLYTAFVPLSAIGSQLLGMGSYLIVVSILLLHRMIRRMIRSMVAHRESRFRATVATALGRLGEPVALTPLARAALDPDAQVRLAAEPALRAGLARLSAVEAAATDPDLTLYLCRLLERNRERLSENTPLAEAVALDILSALEKIGDGRAAPTVRTLINTGWTAPVNHAARQLLPLLLAHQQQKTDQSLLLRGAIMPVDPPETLLRPTDQIPCPDPPETLLRLPRQEASQQSNDQY